MYFNSPKKGILVGEDDYWVLIKNSSNNTQWAEREFGEAK